MIHLKINEILEILEKHDKKNNMNIILKEPSAKSVGIFENAIRQYCNDNGSKKYSVLGIDIYKYSKFEYERQKLIPVLFRFLVRETIKNCFELESSFSLYYENNEIENNLIDTGDGGYLIFNDPIDSIIFSVYFNANLHAFNSFRNFPKLRKILGPITIRYAITLDRVYKIDSRFYGPGIINNSRIMSKDKLNRLLIDGNTYEWFLLNTNGIENISRISDQLLFTQKPLRGLTQDKIKTLIFNQRNDIIPVIKNVFCQKLEKINIKDDEFDVYNLIIQTCLYMYDEDDIDKETVLTTTIGNMNCNGI